MLNCSKCNNEYKKTKRKSTVCLPCKRLDDKAWREYRKSIGKPVISKKLAYYWYKNWLKDNKIQKHKLAVRAQTRRLIKSGKLNKLPC